jgi:hypothetical protein
VFLFNSCSSGLINFIAFETYDLISQFDQENRFVCSLLFFAFVSQCLEGKSVTAMGCGKFKGKLAQNRRFYFATDMNNLNIIKEKIGNWSSLCFA